jgi:hypothetical protein
VTRFLVFCLSYSPPVFFCLQWINYDVNDGCGVPHMSPGQTAGGASFPEWFRPLLLLVVFMECNQSISVSFPERIALNYQPRTECVDLTAIN